MAWRGMPLHSPELCAIYASQSMAQPAMGTERGCSSGVEHHVANVRVEGSNPFARSNLFISLICGHLVCSDGDRNGDHNGVQSVSTKSSIGASGGTTAVTRSAAASDRKTYRKTRITRWRRGWRYKRVVPQDVRHVVGASAWSKYLGAVSEPDAMSEARKLDVIHDDLIRRARGLSPDAQEIIAVGGGLKSARADALKVAEGLKEPERTEADVDLNAPDAIAQLKHVRRMRGLTAHVKHIHRETQDALAAVTPSDQASKLAALIPTWLRVAAPRQPKSIQKKRLYVGRLVKVVGDLEPRASSPRACRHVPRSHGKEG